MAKETKKVLGIEVTLDPDILQDWDVVNDIVSVMNDDDGQERSSKELKEMFGTLNRLIKVLYGDEFENIKATLRDKHNGNLPFEIVSQFIGETFNAFAKN